MKTLATTLILSLLFGAPIMAGSNHNHGPKQGHTQTPVNQEVAEKNAYKIITSFIEKGKIDKSWSSIKASSAQKKVFNGHPEWVVIFINKKITDINKQKLYVFLTISGNYIALNYTGN